MVLYAFRKMSAVFLRELSEACLPRWCAGYGFGELGATLRLVVHGAWRPLSVRDELLTLRAVWGISVCVEIVLPCEKPTDCGRLCRRLGLVGRGRLVVNHFRFCTFSGFPWRG